MNKQIISWFSGGVTSAVTGKLCIDLFGLENVRFIFMDTANEHESTYKFIEDCQEWFDKEIEIITKIGKEYENIQQVWRKHKSLNVAHGAICSSELKRRLRVEWEKKNEWKHQAFGFDINEAKRAKGISKNNPQCKAIFPLMMYGMTKKDCVSRMQEDGISLPEPYALGFQNNNCFKTGCIQGGIGYWKKIQREYPEKFKAMAAMEHELTNAKHKPVTVCKDQCSAAKESDNQLIFLKPHPDYPSTKTIDDMNGREPEPLIECNGFFGANDLEWKTNDIENLQQNLF